ncbi:uncharacterized protein GGQ84_001211 [Desulfitispora alkaliphila]|uniref:YceD family protein n=1 Tax=Desulfitispora alkaliphila TaxID=622674 RepID=UPI003D22C9EA
MIKLNVEKIKNTPGESIKADYDVQINELIDEGETINLSDNLKINLLAKNTGSEILVSGKIETALKMMCGRCLTETDCPIDIDFEEIFVHKSKAEYIDNSDDDIIFFEGNNIHLDQIVAKNIILNMPIRTFCDEECKGICPQCGINLNEEKCSCVQDNIDPRMEVLKKLLK